MTNAASPTANVESFAPRQIWTIATVWLALTVATCLSWSLRANQGIGNAHVISSVIVLLIACVKIRFVGIYFMELRDAPTSLRVIFEVYCFAVCALCIAMYLLA